MARETTHVTVRNVTESRRIFFDGTGRTVVLNPGQAKPADLTEKQIETMGAAYHVERSAVPAAVSEEVSVVVEASAEDADTSYNKRRRR